MRTTHNEQDRPVPVQGRQLNITRKDTKYQRKNKIRRALAHQLREQHRDPDDLTLQVARRTYGTHKRKRDHHLISPQDFLEVVTVLGITNVRESTNAVPNGQKVFFTLLVPPEAIVGHVANLVKGKGLTVGEADHMVRNHHIIVEVFVTKDGWARVKVQPADALKLQYPDELQRQAAHALYEHMGAAYIKELFPELPLHTWFALPKDTVRQMVHVRTNNPWRESRRVKKPMLNEQRELYYSTWDLLEDNPLPTHPG